VPARADDGRSARERINGLIADIEEFRDARRLRRVVVINVASTEPPTAGRPCHERSADLESALDSDEAALRPSSEYAYAAMRAGCSYVDFTPSTGARLPALDELARSVGVPYAGSDAKTGETLLVSALAPMFTARALRVRSWSGTNLLGGGDGATLADAGAAASKTISKRRGLERLLGAPAEGRTHIDNVPAQGGWKTAWDHVGFQGFLGVGMTMQVTWQGCDSALAAPLVLDLARLLARAHEIGATGAFAPGAFFFKDPVPANSGQAVEYRLASQYEALVAWARSASVTGP
jgi:myo-inositol-1-phosphate synthase